MSSKLTLRLDEDLIRFGKRWAHPSETESEELPPKTRELLGSLKDVDEWDYYRYLERKHS